MRAKTHKPELRRRRIKSDGTFARTIGTRGTRTRRGDVELCGVDSRYLRRGRYSGLRGVQCAIRLVVRELLFPPLRRGQSVRFYRARRQGPLYGRDGIQLV